MLKKRDSMVLNWRKTVWLIEQVFISCGETNTAESEALYLSAIDCTLAWLKVGQLPLDSIGPIYPYLLFAAAHFLPRR